MSAISYRGAGPIRLEATVRAGFWIRTLALAIDLVLIAALYVAVFVALVRRIFDQPAPPTSNGSRR